MSRRRPTASVPAGPVHMVARSGDDTSICGIKDPLPVVLARHAEAHVDGWGAVLCPDCVTPPGQRSIFDVLEATA